ncbi:transcription factor bHLH51 [Rhodamnia argentea]|uniref:Transcription factor bHLH51 n=1 Tax=Rhodamnia argentea TaxID=178133 RepID=A0A8B8Q093_9MYRT|nr:transcription factor bHLH51 [Rhodamnia argentea]
MENFSWISDCSGEADWVHSDEQLNTGVYPTPSQAAVLDPIQVCNENFPWLIPIGGRVEVDDRATSASASASASVSKSHSQAEKRRRDRINAQLATLRKLIPKSEKMDKAALLASVIDHVKDLKRKASDISKSLTILPSEVDEVTIDCDDPKPKKGDHGVVAPIRVSICCDDRPELLSELTRVIKGLKLTTVKAEVASVGGRIKSVLVLCGGDYGNGSGGDQGACLSSLKQSLKVVVSRIACSSLASNCRIRSKRQRFFLPRQSPLP